MTGLIGGTNLKSLSAANGLVFDIRRFSIHDGPGIRTAVFFKGCPLSCRWCHNPESQSAHAEIMLHAGRCIRCGACAAVCDRGAIPAELGDANVDLNKCDLCGACIDVCYSEAREIVGREMTVAQVMSEIERDIPFFDESHGGVTFTGGEPLVQRGFLLELLRECRAREIHTALDTCGFAAWEAFESVRGYVDLFLYDLKLVDDNAHREFTGVSNVLILQNLHRLAAAGHRIILRVPVIPGVNDDTENIRRTGELAASLAHVERVDLLPYHHAGADKYDRLSKTYLLPQTRPPSDARMSDLERALLDLGLTVQIGG